MKLLRSLWGRLINNRVFSFFRKKKLSPTEQSLKKVEQKLLDLHQVSNPDPVKIEELIEQKSTLEVSKELEERKLSPVFDKIQLEEDVQKLNYRNFELEKQSRVLASTPISPWDEPPINLQNIDSLIDTLGSSVDLSGLIPPIISEEDLEASFQDFGLVKTFEEREAIRVRDERELEQQISFYFGLVERFIQEEKADEARGHISDLQNRINSTTDLLKQRKWRSKLKTVIEELESLDVRLLLRRQEDELRRKEEEELKRKEALEASENSSWDQGTIWNSEEYNQILKTYRLSGFYHMTHIDNLEGVLKQGMLSHNEARAIGAIRDISDNKVNKRRSKKESIYNRPIHDYVPFYFNPRNAMLFKRLDLQPELVILKVDRRVIYQKNSLFTDGNAASNETSFFNDLAYIDKIDFKVLNERYWKDLVDGKRKKMAEVLVYPKLVTHNIEKIYFYNNTNDIDKRIKNILDKLELDIDYGIDNSGSFFFN